MLGAGVSTVSRPSSYVPESDCSDPSILQWFPADNKKAEILEKEHRGKASAMRDKAIELYGAFKIETDMRLKETKKSEALSYYRESKFSVLQADICHLVVEYHEFLKSAAAHDSEARRWTRVYLDNQRSGPGKDNAKLEIVRAKGLRRIAEMKKQEILVQRSKYYPALRQKLGLNIRQKLKKLRKILTRS